MTESKTSRRPTNIEDMLALAKFSLTTESYEAALRFQPRPDDIIISPQAKCGTTWIQQIAHGLRTRGSMDFEEINDVIPYIEHALDLNWDLDAEQVANPRLFKAHLDWDSVPKNARYIYAVRHPYDVAVSFYRFLEGWFFEKGSIPLEDFVRQQMVERRVYWHHVRSWWEQRDNPDILFLCYEEMQTDISSHIRAIADFMHIELDDDLFKIVKYQSSRRFMLSYQKKFTDTSIQIFNAEGGGVPLATNAAKITSGTPDDKRYQLSEPLKREFDAIWQEVITEQSGLASYGDLRAELRERLRARE